MQAGHPLERTLEELYGPSAAPLPRYPAAGASAVALPAFLGRELGGRLALDARDGTTRELRPASMNLVGELVWRLAIPVIGLWAIAARALPPHPARVAVEPHLRPFPYLLVSVSAGPFACLAADADAGHPDATVVDEPDLVAHWSGPLAAETVPAIVAAHLAIVGDAVDEDALLLAAGDALANAFLAVGARLGLTEALAASARRIIAGLPGGLGVEVELETVELPSGRAATYAVKSACCGSDARVGGERCAACPERRPAERAATMRRALG